MSTQAAADSELKMRMYSSARLTANRIVSGMPVLFRNIIICMAKDFHPHITSLHPNLGKPLVNNLSSILPCRIYSRYYNLSTYDKYSVFMNFKVIKNPLDRRVLYNVCFYSFYNFFFAYKLVKRISYNKII